MTTPVDAAHISSAYVSSDVGETHVGTVALAGEPEIRRRQIVRKSQGRRRTNSRRGATDPAQRSYPPVQAVCRALDILRTLNRLRIASIQQLHEATGFPKPSIVRMLETLLAEGYVARDNMCGGYCDQSRARARVRLSGYLADHRDRPAICDRTHPTNEMADWYRRARRRRDRDQVLDRHDQPGGAHQYGARAGPDLATTAMGARCSRSVPTVSASSRSAACAPTRARFRRGERSVCGRFCGKPGLTALQRAIPRQSPIASPRSRCRSATTKPCTRSSMSVFSRRRFQNARSPKRCSRRCATTEKIEHAIAMAKAGAPRYEAPMAVEPAF